MQKKITGSRIFFVLLSMSVMLLLLSGMIIYSYQKSYRHMMEQADTLLEKLLASDAQNDPDSHYFSVDIGENHTITGTKLVNIRSDVRDLISDYVRTALAQNSDRGTVDTYRFRKQSVPESRSLRIIFLSRAGNLSMLKSNTDSVIQAALIAYLVFSLLMVFLSRLIVKPIKDADKKQKEFISYAGHALKTPITVIRASADLLEEETEKNEWTETIRAQAEYLSEMSDRLVLISKMEGLSKAENQIAFPLSDVTQEILHSFAPVAAQKELSVEGRIEDGITCKGNENELRQLITVLLDNAHKYAGPHGEVLVSLTAEGGEIRLCVENTSRPYSREELDTLFDKFYRGESNAEKGFGLGLYLALLIVSRHCGTISATMKAPSRILLSVILKQKTLPKKDSLL